MATDGKSGAKTGGRVKGTPNKLTADVKEIARGYGPEIIGLLIKMARDDETPHAAKVAAMKEIMDRGYGKSTQPISGAEDAPPIQVRAITEVKIIGVRSSGNPDT